MNTLYYGDNLKILRDYIKDEAVDLVYLTANTVNIKTAASITLASFFAPMCDNAQARECFEIPARIPKRAYKPIFSPIFP